MKYTRITVGPDQMGGVPCIRGLCIPVSTVVSLLADGMTNAAILDAYPDLETEDIREAVKCLQVGRALDNVNRTHGHTLRRLAE